MTTLSHNAMLTLATTERADQAGQWLQADYQRHTESESSQRTSNESDTDEFERMDHDPAGQG